MEHSILMAGIKEKDIQYYFSRKEYGNTLLFQNFFPLKNTYRLSYTTLIGSKGNPVAADIVSYNASAPEKTRKVIEKLTGKIPPTRISRKLDESQLNDFNEAKVLAGPESDEVLDFIFNDSDACIEGCLAKMELITFQILSQTYLSLNKSSNGAGIVTENNIDFQMKAANKRVVKSSSANRKWNDATAGNPKPITDIEVIVAVARAAGIKLNYLLMDQTKWEQFRKTTEVITMVAGNSTQVAKPTRKTVNEYMVAQGLPKIIVIESYVDVEDEDHVVTETNCWTTKYVTFIPDMKLGNVLCGPIAAEKLTTLKQATKIKKGPILVLKYSEPDPAMEKTIGLLNAFPTWPTIDRCYRFDTELNAADGLDD